MKDSIKSFLAIGTVMLVTIACTLIVQNCLITPQTDEDAVIEIVNAELYDNNNPVFNTPEDALTYYDQTVDDRISDSIFTAIPRDVFIKVNKVVSGRLTVYNKQDILIEYLRNFKPVYQYLDETKQDPPAEKQINEYEKAVRVTPDSSGKDTVINGVLYKIQRE
jgi:hypothetical protein